MSYFAGGDSGEGDLRIVRSGELRGFDVSSGIQIFPVLGERMNINVVELAPGAVAAVHSHDEEQLGYVVRGTCDFTDGKSSWTLGPGDVYHALPRVPHGATAHQQGCTIIDVFSPPRAGVREMLEG